FVRHERRVITPARKGENVIASVSQYRLRQIGGLRNDLRLRGVAEVGSWNLGRERALRRPAPPPPRRKETKSRRRPATQLCPRPERKSAAVARPLIARCPECPGVIRLATILVRGGHLLVGAAVGQAR